MKVVAYAELVIFVRVALGAITFQNALVSPLIYGHFLRQRHYQSAFTREALAAAAKKIDDLVRRPGIPPMAAQVWEQAKMLAGRWAGSNLAPQAGDGGAGGGAEPRR